MSLLSRYSTPVFSTVTTSSASTTALMRSLPLRLKSRFLAQ